jgi:hypothetical protein
MRHRVAVKLLTVLEDCASQPSGPWSNQRFIDALPHFCVVFLNLPRRSRRW